MTIICLSIFQGFMKPIWNFEDSGLCGLFRPLKLHILLYSNYMFEHNSNSYQHQLMATCHIFLGFEFLVRNEKKNGIPYEKREKNEKNPTL